ncbi:pinin/SDK/memA domain-containing protein [Phanerochaete sordida]|uniref:Pinin/SDK/memA domain-containing protein n=1 Tax=Phanerochaete sordida TaxID=48140 RepID=A0A9P3LK47_9APHY|nr:pinin/SDK/memA domain-containing protein [Phanerochaete sordida]
MSTEETPQIDEKPKDEPQDAQMQDAGSPTRTADAAAETKKRPRLDLTTDSRERKRGKTMFGLLLGTLNKAKNEDRERQNSEAARKRQMIEQRLQDKLRKETDSVRRAEEAKKDKTAASRKEEELQLKDSIHKLRRTRLPLLANFLSTADHIPRDSSSSPTSTDPLALPPKSHPPPLYYLPAILLPEQEAFLNRRKAEVKDAAEREWDAFKEERTAGLDEIAKLRQRVAEEEERKKTERKESGDGAEEQDVKMDDAGDKQPKEPTTSNSSETAATEASIPAQQNGASMEVDDEDASASKDEPKPDASKPKESSAALLQAAAADEDDAVEY